MTELTEHRIQGLLHDAAASCADLSRDGLLEALQHRAWHPVAGGEGRSSNVPESSAPTSEPWATTLTTIECATVTVWHRLGDLMGFQRRPISRTARQTLRTLTLIPARLEATAPPVGVVLAGDGEAWTEADVWAYLARQVTGWARMARAALDERRPGEIRPTRAPGGLTCAYCPGEVLELRPGWYETLRYDDEGQVIAESLGEPLTCPRCRAAWPASTWTGLVLGETA